jgi:hypothetical protein
MKKRADVTGLSLRARQAIALHFLENYCDRNGLRHPLIGEFVDHFWEVVEKCGDQQWSFPEWENRRPDLVLSALGDPYPEGFETALRAAGADPTEFRIVIECAAEVTYSSAYGAADEMGSRRMLGLLAEIGSRVGANWPDLQRFESSSWSGCDGWGPHLTPEQVAKWRERAVDAPC